MAITNSLDRIVTYVILSLFLLGVIEATAIVPQETPWYTDLYSQMKDGDFTKFFDLMKMGFGWSAITPTVSIAQIPFWLQWYGWYYSLFMPQGIIPVPSLEIFVFVFLILLFIMLPLAIVVKGNRKAKMKGADQQFAPLGLPLWFYLLFPVFLLLLYPLWVWFNLQLFIYGTSGFFNIPLGSAEAIWVGFGEKSESFSWFLVMMSLLGIYKAGVWSKRAKVGF